MTTEELLQAVLDKLNRVFPDPPPVDLRKCNCPSLETNLGNDAHGKPLPKEFRLVPTIGCPIHDAIAKEIAAK